MRRPLEQHGDVATFEGLARPASGLDLARQVQDLAQVGIDAIGESDVNDAIKSAERHGGFRAVASERPKAFALASGKEYDDGIPHIGHWLPPRCG